MNDYKEVRIGLDPCTEDMTDVLAAVLADAGFESFVADSEGLTAYIRDELYEDSMSGLPRMLPFQTKASWSAKTIEGRDWNHEWEKNYFKPIVVGDAVVIHSSFHTGIPKCKYDIVIDPKMAFGTGHHSTTWLMISSLLDADLGGKSLIDMGTGTGILAILASMRGAAPVAGIEIDEAAYVNAIENIRLNGCPDITLIHGDSSSLSAFANKADFFLANINRNVITSDMERYAACLRHGGRMFLSGFYIEDVDIVEEAAAAFGLRKDAVFSRDNWACVHLSK